MKTAKRATVYLDADVHRALRRKALETELPVSRLVNTAIRMQLLEDAEDVAAFTARRKQPNLDFAAVRKDLKRRGKV